MFLKKLIPPTQQQSCKTYINLTFSDDEQYQLSKYAFRLMISMSISDLREG